MFSLGSHFLSVNNPSMVHSLVDSFFEGKKALVKERLMDSVRVIVDGLFEEMVGQVKEMLLPPKEESSGGDQQMKKKQKRNSPVKVNSPKKSPTKQNGYPCKPSSPKRPALVFAVKSKPSGPSTSAAVSVAAPKRVLISSENNSSSTSSPSKQSYKKVKFSSSEHYLDVKFEGEDEAAAEEHSFENQVNLKTTHDESNDDGDDDHHLSSSIENPQNEKPENSQPKQQQQQQQRQQTVISGQKKSVVVTCPEEGCGKQLQSGNLKRHLKSHAKLKPYGCTYEQCSYETEHRHDALRHIKSVHLAKKKKKKSENGENEDEEEEEDPVTYLSVKQDLL